MILKRILTKFRSNSNTTMSKLQSSTKINHPKRIFSGIQPTGSVHLGNYLGAVAQWVKMQHEESDVMLSLVDLHSMTLRYDPNMLQENMFEMTAILLACGIDPGKVILFKQSDVPQHTELFWYLSCISTMARLHHLPQYKEKSAQLKDIPLGLFVYPVLQAADILAHKGTHVPVGEDQLQHIQLAQDLARIFNKRYGEIFPVPRAVVTEVSKIRSLRDPNKKMSKSDPDKKSCIYLTDTRDEITTKIKKAVTDFTSTISYDPEKRPGISNLLTIHSAVSGKTVEDICRDVQNLDSLQYKYVVAEAVDEHLQTVRERYHRLLREPQYLIEVLETGKTRAIHRAEETLKDVRHKLGTNLKIKIENLKAIA